MKIFADYFSFSLEFEKDSTINLTSIFQFSINFRNDIILNATPAIVLKTHIYANIIFLENLKRTIRN